MMGGYAFASMLVIVVLAYYVHKYRTECDETANFTQADLAQINKYGFYSSDNILGYKY
jgi:hypothetical protein